MISRAKGIETQLLIIPYTVTLYKEGESILQLSRIESVIWSYINGKRSISDIAYQTNVPPLILQLKLIKFKKLHIIEFDNA